MKNFWESKTLWANLLTIIGALALLVAGTDGLGLSEVAVKWLLVVSGGANIVLRLITSESIRQVVTE